jgi:hypothetical protein
VLLNAGDSAFQTPKAGLLLLSFGATKAERHTMMDDDFKNVQQQELGKTEDEILERYGDRFRPQKYRKVFYTPPLGSDREVDAAFLDGFFESAKVLLQRVIDGEMLESRGVAAVFLCRHYLELAIKYALFHSRWLRDDDTNATNAEIAAVKTPHNLQLLWDTLGNELRTRVPGVSKISYDFDFVKDFVAEFHRVDSGNWRFRCPAEEFSVATGNPRHGTQEALGIDFQTLLVDLQHVEEVLSDLDARLVNTHGLNEEWESQQNSF